MRGMALAVLGVLAIGGCGGSSGTGADSGQTPSDGDSGPSSLSVADLQRDASFFAAQPKAGQLVLVRLCKIRVAEAAARQAKLDADQATGTGGADLIDAAPDIVTRYIQDVDAESLRQKVGRALGTVSKSDTIGQTCRDQLTGAVTKGSAAISKRVHALNAPYERAIKEVESRPDPHQVAIKGLLRDKGAIGKTKAAIREKLGRPDSTQDVGDELIWYYETSANSYQVTFSSGVVDGVNRYGK